MSCQLLSFDRPSINIRRDLQPWTFILTVPVTSLSLLITEVEGWSPGTILHPGCIALFTLPSLFICITYLAPIDIGSCHLPSISSAPSLHPQDPLRYPTCPPRFSTFWDWTSWMARQRQRCGFCLHLEKLTQLLAYGQGNTSSNLWDRRL